MQTNIESMTQSEKSSKTSQMLGGITVEHLLYGLIIMLAAILRLSNLGSPPLSPVEAKAALSAWDLWQIESAFDSILSPAYFSLTAFLSQVIGFSDTSVRIIPAVFGTSLVFLPWFLRHRTGRLGTLIAALLLAFSPTLVSISRTAGGDSIALFAGFLLFISWLRFQESGNPRCFLVFSSALALGLTSSSLFYSIFLALIVAWAVQRLIGPPLIIDSHGEKATFIKPATSTIKLSLIIFGGVFLICATAILLAPRGIGATSDIVVNWLDRFSQSASIREWLLPFMAIGSYEIGMLIIGIPAIIWAARSEIGYPTYLVYWILGTIILLVLQRGELSNIPALTIPTYLLIGRFTGALSSSNPNRINIATVAVIFIAAATIYANLIRYSRFALIGLSSTGTYNLLFAFIALVIAVILILLAWSWDSNSAKRGTLLGLIFVIVLLMWSNAWWLGQGGANEPRELWVHNATDNDIRLFAKTINEISWQATNSQSDLGIESTVNSPVIEWYLRDMENIEFGLTTPQGTNVQALITSATEPPKLDNAYVSAEFGYQRLDQPQPTNFLEILRWLFFHESSSPVAEERLIFWLRSDLAGENL